MILSGFGKVGKPTQRPRPKRQLPSTPANDGFLKGVFEDKQYGKTKAEREYVDARGPPRFLFDGESTMDKFKSEHPVQMSQDTYRAVILRAKSVAPFAFVSEEKIGKTDSVHAKKAHIHILPKSKALPNPKAPSEYKSQRRLLQERLQEHEATWDQEFKDAFARRQARTLKPKAQNILELQRKRAAILDRLLDNDQERIDLERRRREKKLRARGNPIDHAIARRFQTSKQSLIFKHDGGRRRRKQSVETKFRFKKQFNTDYADRMAREKYISKASF